MAISDGATDAELKFIIETIKTLSTEMLEEITIVIQNELDTRKYEN